MSSHIIPYHHFKTYGSESWPHPPLVARRKVGGEELVPAQQAYLPSVTLGGFRPRKELRKIHDRVASTVLSMRVFSPNYSVQSIHVSRKAGARQPLENEAKPSQNSNSTVVSSSIASASLPRPSSKSISRSRPCLATQAGGLNRYLYPSSQVECFENTL